MKIQFNKMISLVMTMILCFLFCFPVSAAEPKESSDDIKEKLINYIVVFYEEKDLGKKTYKNDSLVSERVSEFLSDKSEVQHYVSTLYETHKENYNIDVVLIDLEEYDFNKVFKFQVITEYNYVNADFRTTVSEDVIINYNCNSKEIESFYTPNNYYDMAVLETEKLFSNDNMINNAELTSKKDKLIKSINDVYKFETSVKRDNTQTIVPLATQSFNNNACATYARNNYNKATPSSGNGSVPYYDFSTISGSYDCTNFVSHALLAGGAKIYDTGNSGISSTGWYFRNINNRSSSWSGVTNLYNFLTTNKKSNTVAGTGKSYELSGAYWGVGDVMQFKNSGSSVYSHSTIITIKSRTSDGKRCYAYVTGRTSKTQYNNNQAAADMAPGGAKRTIMIYNQ